MLYRQGQLFGGLVYSLETRGGSSPDLAEAKLRPMAEQAPDPPLFGIPFLLTALFRRAPQITTR